MLASDLAGAEDYLHAALERDDVAALDIVRRAIAAGTPSVEIMLDILQPAQVEVGRLWADGHIGIPDEQHVTALTKRSLLLLERDFPAHQWAEGPRLVSIAVGPHAHEIGIQMITQLMQQAGWQTTYLGNNETPESAARFVAASRPTVLALSVTLTAHVPQARSFITAVREQPRCADTSILVGGPPFNANPDLADAVGADGWGRDAREAVTICQRWLEDLAQRKSSTEGPPKSS